MPQMSELHQQTTKFKLWAATADQRSGQWECDYENWHDLWSAASNTITAYQDGSIPDVEAFDLLYILGRDNECEYVREGLLASPELIAALALRAIGSNDADAKWQIAISVAESKLPNAADLLRPFLCDTDEYVRRRTLMAFAPFVPKEAEAIAIMNLDDEFEYTRIAALHVLHTVGSNSLDASLDRLAADPSKYVRQNVEELRASRKEA
ncbi:MAG: HEAT repeat domain-containing protein [Rubinisphaera brasiliensis]|uniref:HEAT repeat domain-containing protein n=1 Tax=Rubinisphaera brasiliensis TaxID=119 RepID=UPI00391B6027